MKSLVLLFSRIALCAGLARHAVAAVAVAGLVGIAHSQTLPEFQGRFPIETPRYEGVDQLLVLSDRWVVVVTSTLDELVAEIDGLSDGIFGPAAAAWDVSRDTDRPDWLARFTVERLRSSYSALARRNIREDLLDSTASFAITSDTDNRYAAERAPSRVGRVPVGTGDTRIIGGPDVDYYQYCYIEFPEPMRNSHRYTVTVRGGERVTFRFDPNRTISRAIKVNQIGYLTDAPRKIAYLGCHIYDVGPMDCSAYTEFQVVNAETGAEAFKGRLRLRERNAMLERSNGTERMLNGEDVYEIDFTGLRDSGTFFIRIPGVGRSWPFKHGPDVYGEAFYTSARALYHQRCGSSCEEPYTRWPRAQCHTDPVYESELIAFPIGEFEKPGFYERFDIVGATLDESRPHYNVRGGWHDAADWDKNSMHYTVVFDLLYAYELAPGKFTDGQLNIPESGNGIPDVLDEARYGLLVWAASMDSAGGVSGFLETNTHPAIDADSKYAFSQRTRWDSLQFAAAAAQLAEHLNAFDSREAQRWAWRARKAYSFGSDPANSLGKTQIHAREDRGAGAPYLISWEEKDEFIAPYLLHARLRLFRISGHEAYLDGWEDLVAHTRPPTKWPFTIKDHSPWFYYALVAPDMEVMSEGRREELIKRAFLDTADYLVELLEELPYRRSMRRNQEFAIAWGVSDMTNAARMLFIAYALTGDEKYRDAGILNVDFMFGANPMGMSWTTGIGYSYPVNIQHAPSVTDGIADPVPGITIYGFSGGMFSALKEEVWRTPGGILGLAPLEFNLPDVPVWRMWSCHPTLNTAQCEFTIHETVSSTIFCTGFLTPDGWLPSPALQAAGPRPEEALYGYFYLP